MQGGNSKGNGTGSSGLGERKRGAAGSGGDGLVVQESGRQGETTAAVRRRHPVRLREEVAVAVVG
jgi:hypothetical protein